MKFAMDFNKRKRRNSSVFTESETSETETADENVKEIDDLVQNIIRDPEKRAQLLHLLTHANEAIINKNTKGLQCDKNPAKNSTPMRIKTKIRFESPSALWRRRAKEKQQTSESSQSSSVQRTAAVPVVPFEKLLEGVVGYVELRCKGEDKSLGAKKLMIAMGAEVRDSFTRDVTHVVFKDGSFDTYYKARLMKIHLVSILWLDAIKTTGIRVPEQKFPALGFSSKDHDLSKICLNFQNDYEEMIENEFQKALTTTILSQSFHSDLDANKRKRTCNRLNFNIISSSEENKKSSVQNWVQNLTNSSNSDNSCDIISDVESDCGMVDGCSVKKSRQLEKLNQSVSNYCLENDTTTKTFSKSELGNLLLSKDKEGKEQKSCSRGTHSSSTSDSKSLLTGRNFRRSGHISIFNGSKSSNTTENLSSLRLSTDTEQKRDTNSSNTIETELNNLEKATGEVLHEAENKMNQTKKKRRKLFNPDEFLLEEENADNEHVQERREATEKSQDVRQPIVLLNPLSLTENVNKNSSNNSQKNLLPNENSPNKKSSNRETDSSPTKQNVARRRSVRIQTKKFSQKVPLETSDAKRRSSYDFIPKEKGKPLNHNRVRKAKISSIVCTRLHRPEVKTFLQIVKKLGTFYAEPEVSNKTTHLVVGETRRTINILRALIRGCWILKIEWLYKSFEVGHWIEEEDYELTEFSPAVQQCRKQRQAFGSLYSMDIFKNVGPIFVSNASVPKRSDLEELIVLCNGTITDNKRAAGVVVGETSHITRGAAASIVYVSEKWILDSITYNKLKPFKNYLLR